MKGVLGHVASAAAGAAAVLLFVLAAGESDRTETGEPPAALQTATDADRDASPSGALEDLRAEKETLAERSRKLENELAGARADLEEARRRIETPPAIADREASRAAPQVRIRRTNGEESPGTAGPADAEPVDDAPEPMRMKRYVVLGEGLTDEAVRKLGLDEEEKSRIESAVAEEEQRLHAGLEMFARESERIGDPKPGETTPGLLTRLLHESGMTESMMKFHEENPEALEMLHDGRLSLRDVLGEKSDAYRLLSVMRETRRQTHDDVGRILDAGRAAVFAGEIHPPGLYNFKGNLNLALMGPLTPEEAAEAAAQRNGGG